MTTRRKLLVAMGMVPLLAPGTSWPQQQPAKVARIGWLSPVSRTDEVARLNAFTDALQKLGYVEGKNLVIEGRWAQGKYERLAQFAAELVRLPVDVLVTQHTPTAQAAKQATSTIPIVMASVSGDPVASGLIASLARPGGNITGITSVSGEVSVKWLELLKEASPRVRRIAVLLNPDTRTATAAAIRAAAKALKLELREFEVRRSDELESAFARMAASGLEAVAVHADSMFTSERRTIAGLAAKHRLPSVGTQGLAEAGGLIGYGPYPLESVRGAATLVDKILKGAKPADLPVQQVSRFTLVVNSRTAKALGMPLPQGLLLRADKVIE